MEYESVDFSMKKGDIAVMYTDGINEAMDSQDEEFGMEKMRELTCQGGDADAIKIRIVDAVLAHVGSAPPFDDMCVVVIERTDNASPGGTIADTVDDDVIDTAF